MSRSQRRYGRKAHRRFVIKHGESRHHKRCKSNGGGLRDDNGHCNISIVKQVDHNAWHMMFSNLLPPTICEIINQKWLDARWKFICVPNNQDNYDS